MAKKKVKKSEKVSPLSFLPRGIKGDKITLVGLLKGEDGLYHPLKTRLALKDLKEADTVISKADLYEMGLDRCETALLGAKLTKDH
jgi:hypothetical protein